jgi:hypothetical protein
MFGSSPLARRASRLVDDHQSAVLYIFFVLNKTSQVVIRWSVVGGRLVSALEWPDKVMYVPTHFEKTPIEKLHRCRMDLSANLVILKKNDVSERHIRR